MLLSETNLTQSLDTDLMPQNQSTLAPAILATNLTKTVGDVSNPISILRDLHLSVAQGESVAIVGSSGSGKSTLLGLLAGLDNATSGGVTERAQVLAT